MPDFSAAFGSFPPNSSSTRLVKVRVTVTFLPRRLTVTFLRSSTLMASILGAQDRCHQGGGTEESDGQTTGQEGDRHPDLYQACRRGVWGEGPEGRRKIRHDDD